VKSELELQMPKFATDEQGKSVVVLDRASYIALLIRGNVTDPSYWPPGTEEGARALARIRQIEHECIAKYGEFDWEKLPPEVQDEYDALCSLLDRLTDTGERISLSELLTEERSR